MVSIVTDDDDVDLRGLIDSLKKTHYVCFL